jgi:hypothetical protein
MNSLPLPKFVELPTLRTDPVFLGHAKKADLVWTQQQFTDLCRCMLNENPDNFFLVPYRDKTGKVKYAKANRASAAKQIPWAWDTIRGRAKYPGGIGFYPTNVNGESCWGAIDLDAHDGDKFRARDLAFKAFEALLQYPALYLILGPSGGGAGGGWHLFIFTADFHPVGNWARMLRNVADLIRAPVQKGTLEIFPDDHLKGIGNGIRAPGSWHPKSGDFSLVAFERVSQLPQLVSSTVHLKRHAFLGTRLTSTSLHENELLSLPSSGENGLYRGERGEWVEQFAITRPRSRHGQNERLAGHAFLQAGRNVAIENARLLHGDATCEPATSINSHIDEFEKLWAGLERKWLEELSNSERRMFDALTTRTGRDAFRIIRNWSRAEPAAFDFKIVARNLGDRLGVSLPWASNIRRQFCTAGILQQTADYVAHQKAARYRWTANELKGASI